MQTLVQDIDCKKSVHILSYSGPYFPAFGQNTERYGVETHQKSMMDWLTIFAETFHYRFLTGFKYSAEGAQNLKSV